MLSKACEYGLRALIFIVSETANNEARVDIKTISEAIDSPQHFTAKILQQLSRANIIESVKGPNGGFYATDRTEETKIIEVMRLMGGEHRFDSCLLGLEQCSEESPCPLHHDFRDIKQKLNRIFEKTSLGELANDLNTRDRFLR
jgi:Rrf2 family protein